MSIHVLPLQECRERRKRVIRSTLFLAAAVTGCVVCWGAYGAWRASLCSRHMDDFFVVFSALHSYSRDWDRLPEPSFPDLYGSPICSWRFHLLRYMEQPYYPIPTNQRPWYDPENQAWAAVPHSHFCFCRGNPRHATTSTTLFAVTGPGTAFDASPPTGLSAVPAHTIILIEVCNSGTHWMEPGDLDIRQVLPEITRGTDGRGVIVAFADGQVWFLDRTVPLRDLKKFFAMETAERCDREVLLGPYCRLRR